MSVPKSAIITIRPTRLAPVKVALRNTRTSSIALRLRRSTRTKSTAATADPAKRPTMSGEPQPCLLASVSAKTAANVANPASSRPGTSSR